jgi:hypothetical protein
MEHQKMSHETTVEAAVAGASAVAAGKAMWSGAAVGGFGALSQSAVIGWVGVLIAFAGLLMNWYYRHKEYKLKERQVEESCK